MIDTIEWINARLTARTLVCIDGPAGAGKTTLAAQLQAVHAHARVIHMDELYNGWTDALGPELSDRLTSGIRDPFRRGTPIRYQRYDWSAAEFAEHVEFTSPDLLVVEGVGAAQAAMRPHALTVFLDVDPELGRLRVLERDGDVSAAQIADWQRQERLHFDADRTRAGVDLYVP